MAMHNPQLPNREAVARIVKGARLSSAFGREFRTGDGRLDDVDLDAADAILALIPSPDQGEAEAYEIGKNEGYADAVQWIDARTGGDGEYRYCLGLEDDERHCPGPVEMREKIVARFNDLATPPVDSAKPGEALDEYVTITLSRDGTVTSHNSFDADFDEMVVAIQTIVTALQARLEARGRCPYSHGAVLRKEPLSASLPEPQLGVEAQAFLERFDPATSDTQSPFVIVHQLRASADIQDRQTKRETGWADTSDRAQLMRKAATGIEMLASALTVTSKEGV